jgi:hypothetical protein
VLASGLGVLACHASALPTELKPLGVPDCQSSRNPDSIPVPGTCVAPGGGVAATPAEAPRICEAVPAHGACDHNAGIRLAPGPGWLSAATAASAANAPAVASVAAWSLFTAVGTGPSSPRLTPANWAMMLTASGQPSDGEPSSVMEGGLGMAEREQSVRGVMCAAFVEVAQP